MNTIYCDSSVKKACFLIEGQEAVFVPHLAPVTVNVGEYKAVILALEEAKRLKLEHVLVLSDSQLVVYQVGDRWACRKPHLLPLRDRVRELIQEVDAFIAWIPREDNLAGYYLETKKRRLK